MLLNINYTVIISLAHKKWLLFKTSQKYKVLLQQFICNSFIDNEKHLNMCLESGKHLIL